jgi:hypothetical protein
MSARVTLIFCTVSRASRAPLAASAPARVPTPNLVSYLSCLSSLLPRISCPLLWYDSLFLFLSLPLAGCSLTYEGPLRGPSNSYFCDSPSASHFVSSSRLGLLTLAASFLRHSVLFLPNSIVSGGIMLCLLCSRLILGLPFPSYTRFLCFCMPLRLLTAQRSLFYEPQ